MVYVLAGLNPRFQPECWDQLLLQCNSRLLSRFVSFAFYVTISVWFSSHCSKRFWVIFYALIIFQYFPMFHRLTTPTRRRQGFCTPVAPRDHLVTAAPWTRDPPWTLWPAGVTSSSSPTRRWWSFRTRRTRRRCPSECVVCCTTFHQRFSVDG